MAARRVPSGHSTLAEEVAAQKMLSAEQFVT
jgi:hypothetical protein